MEYVHLGWWQLGIAASLVLVSGAISLALGLDLHRRLLLAALRTVAQLLLIGLVLNWIFRWGTWYVVLGLMTVMTLIAGVAAIRRTGRRWPGMLLDSIVSIWASSWLVTAVALGAVVQVQPWYQPQYAIPLLGMILGNTLNGMALGLDRLGEELAAQRDQVETLLALGATRWEAAREADPASRADRHDPHDQRDDGRRPGEPAGDDDRPIAGGHGPDRRP